MKRQVEPPEEKKRKTKSSTSSSSLPSFSLLPDEITVNYLARISRSYYPRLSIVSKNFKSLLSSTELYAERSHIGTTERCLYLCLTNFNHQFPLWFRLLVNPNRTLPNNYVTKKTKKKKKNTTGQMLVPVPPSNFLSPSKSTATVVGSDIYVIGGLVDGAPSSAVTVLDCRSHTWRDAPNMNVARGDLAYSCVYDGKIYVLGGCKGVEDWAEVFDTNTQTWDRLPDPGIEIRKCGILRIVETEGKIRFGNYSKTYAYDTKEGKWEGFKKERTFPTSDCVIENVSYYGDFFECLCKWYDINDGCWKEVKGLDALVDKYNTNGGLSNSFKKLVGYGGKLLLIWEEYMKRRRKIWCAEITVEKRDEGGEVWGNVEWVDVVHCVPKACRLLHCLAFSV